MVVALVALTWAPGAVKKTPIDVDSRTLLDGQGGKVDLETGELADEPLQAISVYRTRFASSPRTSSPSSPTSAA